MSTSLSGRILKHIYTYLMEKIEKFKKTNVVDLYVRDSRSIEAAQKRLSKKLNKELK